MKNSASAPKYAVSAIPVFLRYSSAFLRDPPRVAVVALPGDRVLHVAAITSVGVSKRIHDMPWWDRE